MRVGATIKAEHMALLQQAYHRIPVSPKFSLALFDSNFREPARAQFEAALKRYKNDGTPYDFDAVRCEGPACGKAKDDVHESQGLLRCSKCKLAHYCSKECQSASWSTHKKVCRTPEQRAETEREIRDRGGIMSLNV